VSKTGGQPGQPEKPLKKQVSLNFVQESAADAEAVVVEAI